MEKKKIGIVGWKIGENSFGVTIPYYNFISYFGEVIILEPNNQINKNLDLLILPGGPDLPQDLYMNEEDKFEINVNKNCPIRTHFIKNILPKYIEQKTPIFGICLGHQGLAITLGKGKLLPNMYHETSPSNERDKEVHKIIIPDKKYNFKNQNFQNVNSLHHQVVKYVDPNFAKPIAFYNGNIKHKKGEYLQYEKHIEALEYINYPAFSVQWHPEELWDMFSINLINILLNNEKKI